MRRMRFAILILVVAVQAILAGQSGPTDWPQFRGPNRDGTAPAFVEPKVWPEQLTKKWQVEVGEGYAGPILVGGRVYSFARQGGNEIMRALDAASGKGIWQTQYAAPVTVNPAAKEHGAGPKSTPAFANGRLYTLGMGGIVTAFDAETGKIVWQKPAGSALPLYGTALSPLVDRGLVIVHVGGNNQGALTAFDTQTGAVKWSWNGDGPSYASPIVAELDSVRQVIALTQENIVGVSAADGRVLWKRPYSTEYTQNIITPMLVGRTLIVAGYQKPTTAIRIVKNGDQWRTEDDWQNERASFYMSNPVLLGDSLFGLSHRNSGQYVLLDVKTGKSLWTGMPRQATNAALVHAGNILFSLEDDGELIVGRVGASNFQELKRYRISDSPTWGAPTVSGNRILVKLASSVALWTLN